MTTKNKELVKELTGWVTGIGTCTAIQTILYVSAAFGCKTTIGKMGFAAMGMLTGGFAGLMVQEYTEQCLDEWIPEVETDLG